MLCYQQNKEAKQAKTVFLFIIFLQNAILFKTKIKLAETLANKRVDDDDNDSENDDDDDDNECPPPL